MRKTAPGRVAPSRYYVRTLRNEKGNPVRQWQIMDRQTDTPAQQSVFLARECAEATARDLNRLDDTDANRRHVAGLRS